MVPNVVGDTQAAATTAITGAGLVVGTVTAAPSGTVPSGDVISESPVAGTSVAAGSAVNLVISSGGGSPTVVSVSPNAALPSNVVTVTITGGNTHFVNGMTSTVTGSLDPTVLLNGIATIQLAGTDQSGQASY